MKLQVGVGIERWDELSIPFTDISLTNNGFPKTGYYYTTIDTLEKILKSGAIYSTNYRYLNDPGEWEFGYRELVKASQKILNTEYSAQNESEFARIIKSALEEEKNYLNDYAYPAYSFLQGNYSEVFTISFTQEEDLISQWDRYAKESGVVLEIDFSLMNEQYFFFKKTINKEKVLVNLRPQYVAYNRSEIMQIGKNVIKTLKKGFENESIPDMRLKTYVYMYMRYFASYIKNTAYEQEKEIRISFYPLVYEQNKKNNIDKCDIKYTIQDGVFVPHIPIYCGKKTDDGEIEVSGFPIRSIRVGPGYNQEAVFKGLIHRMEYGDDLIAHFPETEQKERKICFIIKTIAQYLNTNVHESDSNRQLLKRLCECQEYPQSFPPAEWMRLKNLMNAIYKKSNRDKKLIQQYEEIIGLKQECYNIIFKEAEENNYCTKDGIIIKRSEIPYIFSKK